MGIFDKTVSGNSSLNLLNSDTPLGQLGNMAINEGLNYAKANASVDSLPFFNGAISSLNGDFEGAFNQVVNKNLFDKILKSRNQKLPLLAYHSMNEAKSLVDVVHAIKHASRAIFLINISDYSGGGLQDQLTNVLGNYAGNQLSSQFSGGTANFISNAAKQTVSSAISSLNPMEKLLSTGGGMTSNFNLLATGVSYTPFAIEGETYNIGSAIADGHKSSAKAEISITTLDDQHGTIKRWFKEKASRLIHQDGSVGVISDGLVQITVLHAFASQDVNIGGFEETIICRPVSTDYELQRGEGGLEEFTMRFEQADTWL